MLDKTLIQYFSGHHKGFPSKQHCMSHLLQIINNTGNLNSQIVIEDNKCIRSYVKFKQLLFKGTKLSPQTYLEH